MILTDEFARQASMETDLGIPSALFAAPVREIVELGKSQIGFMNLFAIPLFQGVTDVMPAMGFCVEELQRNKAGWEQKIAEEQEKLRKDSDDSTMKDGMFSPRTMSVANPSDANHQKIGNATLSPDMDLRKALLSKSPFSLPNGVPDDVGPQHSSLPEISTAVPLVEESANPSPSEVLPDSSSRRSSKPSQLQLSFATASAPSLLDHPSQDAALAQNGILVTPSLVADPVVVDPPTPQEPKAQESDKQRSSDGTEGSNSAAGDWTSQATSATTGKMPLSPSTQGTSIMSDSDSIEKGNTSQILTPTGTPRGHGRSSSKDSTTQGSKSEADGEENKGVPSTVPEKVGKLKKKPSRFRMNFWKRSKSASPPMPVGGARVGSEDGMSQ